MIIVGMDIGFEQTNQQVSEDAGSASICVRILQPSGHNDRILNTSYSVTISTQQNYRHGGEN